MAWSVLNAVRAISAWWQGEKGGVSTMKMAMVKSGAAAVVSEAEMRRLLVADGLMWEGVAKYGARALLGFSAQRAILS